jgi:chromate transporter
LGSIAYGEAATWPMLQSEVTQLHQWLTPRECIDGLALGQVTHGPPVVAAAFTGYKLGEVAGAALATFAIFAPSVVMTMLFTEMLAGTVLQLGYAH